MHEKWQGRNHWRSTRRRADLGGVILGAKHAVVSELMMGVPM